ncbi:MAG: DUF2782 domain-containing protein [Gammaproteobacteria bacterium]|nr:DUF2782 domain-containing protein [Gammaproteobacteria bacterium]
MRSRSLIFRLSLTGLFLLALPAQAQEAEPSGEIIIQGEGTGIVEEKRVNGKLYAIKVTPKKGPSYYLVDSDGDGDLETRRNDTDSDLLIPAWVIKQW